MRESEAEKEAEPAPDVSPPGDIHVAHSAIRTGRPGLSWAMGPSAQRGPAGPAPLTSFMKGTKK